MEEQILDGAESAKEYYLGLDLGTKYIGFCACDREYRILKYRRKRMIGTRELAGAQSAEKRRTFRTARRRLARRRQRISFLQSLFQKEMEKIDANFFMKLCENGIMLQDKTFKVKYSLFNDSDKTDVSFHRKYPTIYHLRAALMEEGTNDLRELYLAIHHIIKYRGNFLQKGTLESENEQGIGLAPLIENLDAAIERFNEAGHEKEIAKFALGDRLAEAAKEAEEIFASKTRRAEKLVKLKKAFGAEKGNETLVKAILGYELNLERTFGIALDAIKSVSFEKDYEESVQPLLVDLPDEALSVIDALWEIYQAGVVFSILHGESGLSKAMVAIYEKHRVDLKKLKTFLRKFADPKDYNEVFGHPAKDPKKQNEERRKDENKNNYSHYVGGGRYNGKEKVDNGRLGSTCIQKEFYPFLKKILEEILKRPIAEEGVRCAKSILEEMEKESFLPKVVSKNNSMLPYTLNMRELKAILKKAEETFPFLKEKDSYGSVSEKIMKILEFRIPYFVGPLNDRFKNKSDEKIKRNNGKAWIVRKSYGHIYPWNFSDMVDEEASEREFIERMTNRCTYLHDVPVLAKNSIVYSAYMTLSELNKIKVDGAQISLGDKQAIFDQLYLKRGAAAGGKKSVTIKDIKAYFKRTHGKEPMLSGYADALHGNMSSYLILKERLGDKVDRDPLMAEKIIYYFTVHGESKRALKSIEAEFKNKLTQQEIERLKGLNFSGWGRLSMELLMGSYCENGIVLTDKRGAKYDVLEIMYRTNLSLMEILESSISDYDFKEKQEEYFVQTGQKERKVCYQSVQELYASPAVKHMVWQAISITKEIVSLQKRPPAKIFIEHIREVDKKKGELSVSRKNQALQFLKAARIEAEKLKDENLLSDIKCMEDHSFLNEDFIKLRSDKNFLYILQLGRCMYTGEKININEPDCDIDHIIPQSIKKDDSLDNRVLTTKTINGNKSDRYPLPPEFRNNEARILWEHLRKMKLMSEEKYARLIRTKPLQDEEKRGFIERQLVETSQTAVIVKDLLTRWFSERYPKEEIPKIYFNKAGNISDFRHDYDIVKSRLIGDYHHGVDAYLNAVVGNVLYTKFSQNEFFKKEDLLQDEGDSKRTKFQKAFYSDVYSFAEKRKVWRVGEGGTITTLKEQLSGCDYAISRKATTDLNGEFYNQSLKKGKYISKDGMMFPRKTDGILNTKNEKGHYIYGWQTNANTAYLMVVDHQKKGETIRSIEAMPIYYHRQIAAGKMDLQTFFRDVLQLKNAELAKINGLNQSIIKIGSMIKLDGVPVQLRGVTGGGRLSCLNGMQLFVPDWVLKYVKELERKKRKKDMYYPDDPNGYQILIDVDRARLISEKVKDSDKNRIVIIDKEANLKLYDFLTHKLTDTAFGKLPGRGPMIEHIKSARAIFETKQLADQIEILLDLLKAFDCNSAYVNTTKLSGTYQKENGETAEMKGKASHGKLVFSKNITDKRVELICSSVTGIVEKTILINQGNGV